MTKGQLPGWRGKPASNSGWIAIGLASGYATGTGTDAPASYRYLDGGQRVELSGLVKPTSGSFAASTTFTVMPAGSVPGYRGGAYTFQALAANGPTPVRLIIGTDGSMALQTGSATADYAILDGLTYSTTP